jgi:hypothetical protein
MAELSGCGQSCYKTFRYTGERDIEEPGVISRIVFRVILVVVAFFVAIAVALAVLFALGAFWAGNELRAAAPQASPLQQAAPIFGAVLFAGTVAPALNALPALIAAVAGEVLRIRSWMYYVLAGGAALALIPILAAPDRADFAEILASPYMTIFAAAGFAGGFVYWLLAGSRA